MNWSCHLHRCGTHPVSPPGPGQGFPRPLHTPNAKHHAFLALFFLLWMEFQANHPKLFPPPPQSPQQHPFSDTLGTSGSPPSVGTCSTYLPVVYRTALDSCFCSGIPPFQSGPQLPFSGPQNLPLAPSCLSVPPTQAEDEQVHQALYKPGLSRRFTYPPPSSTPCVVIARSQRRVKNGGRQTSKNVENFWKHQDMGSSDAGIQGAGRLELVVNISIQTP